MISLVHQWLLIVLHAALLAVSLLCLSALYNRKDSSRLTRLAYAVMPIGAGMVVAGLLKGDPAAVDIGEVIITVGMILWSLRILRFLLYNGDVPEKARKRRTYRGRTT